MLTEKEKELLKTYNTYLEAIWAKRMEPKAKVVNNHIDEHDPVWLAFQRGVVNGLSWVQEELKADLERYISSKESTSISKQDKEDVVDELIEFGRLGCWE